MSVMHSENYEEEEEEAVSTAVIGHTATNHMLPRDVT